MGIGYALCPATMQGGDITGIGNQIGFFLVKAGDVYKRQDEGGLAWNDPEIGVEWPLEEGVDLIISEKDQKWKGLKDTFRCV